MGNSNVVWKVNGENKYFQPISGDIWGEFDNGEQVFSFSLVSQNGDKVTLRKSDGSILDLDSEKVVIKYG